MAVGVHFQMVDRADAAGPFKFGSKTLPPWQPVIVAIAFPSSTVFMLYVDKLDSRSVYNVLATLLEDAHKVKVLCDVHLAAAWLHAIGDGDDLVLRKCVDLLLVYELCVNPAVRTASMFQIQSCFGFSLPRPESAHDVEDAPAFLRIFHVDNENHRLAAQSSVSQGVGGTLVVPYRKTIVPDNLVDGRLVSISAMPEYSNKSVEELRYEDSSAQSQYKTSPPNATKLVQNGTSDAIRSDPVPHRKILRTLATQLSWNSQVRSAH